MKKLVFQIIISSIFIISSTFSLSGQEKIIRGSITTFDTIPLIGASIKVKSTKKAVLSDTLGLFAVSCSPKDRLNVTANGFSDQKIKIDEETGYVTVNLKLKPSPKSGELAVAYGHIREEDRIDAMSHIDENDMDFSRYSNIYEIIRGRFPGVQVRGDEIIIRGVSSLYMSSAALLVVDGVVVDASFFKSIPTSDVASINILKGTDASMYGSRGANGVVIVERKR